MLRSVVWLWAWQTAYLVTFSYARRAHSRRRLLAVARGKVPTPFLALTGRVVPQGPPEFPQHTPGPVPSTFSQPPRLPLQDQWRAPPPPQERDPFFLGGKGPAGQRAQPHGDRSPTHADFNLRLGAGRFL